MRYRPHRDMYACYLWSAECPASNPDPQGRIHRTAQVLYSYSGDWQNPMRWTSWRLPPVMRDRPIVSRTSAPSIHRTVGDYCRMIDHKNALSFYVGRHIPGMFS